MTGPMSTVNLSVWVSKAKGQENSERARQVYTGNGQVGTRSGRMRDG